MRPTFTERLWSKVRKAGADECWEWIGNRNQHGYGLIWRSGLDGGHSLLAHRACYEDAQGPIPKGKMACHTCDHPWCVNPAHIFIGTAQDNADDMVRKGRASKSTKTRGEQHHLAKLTHELARQIREAYQYGEMSPSALARAYQVSRSCVMQILLGESWRVAGVEYPVK